MSVGVCSYVYVHACVYVLVYVHICMCAYEYLSDAIYD